MDRKSAGVLLGAFILLLVLVIATFFVDFGRHAGATSTLHSLIKNV